MLRLLFTDQHLFFALVFVLNQYLITHRQQLHRVAMLHVLVSAAPERRAPVDECTELLCHDLFKSAGELIEKQSAFTQHAKFADTKRAKIDAART